MRKIEHMRIVVKYSFVKNPAESPLSNKEIFQQRIRGEFADTMSDFGVPSFGQLEVDLVYSGGLSVSGCYCLDVFLESAPYGEYTFTEQDEDLNVFQELARILGGIWLEYITQRHDSEGKVSCEVHNENLKAVWTSA